MKGNLLKPTRIVRGVFLVLVIVMLITPAAAADSIGDVNPNRIQGEDGSLIENILSAPINGIYNAFMLLGFKSFDELIFNNEYGDMAPYSHDEWDIVMRWYRNIRGAVWALLVIAVAVAGYRNMTSAANPSKKISFMQSISSIVYAFAIVLFMPYAVILIFRLNNALVSFFYGIAQSMGVVGESFDVDTIRTGNVLATAIIKLAFVGLLAYFNFLYLIRKFVLTSMFIITPIVAWSWTISGRKEGIGVVIGEVASNAFMQAAHALVLSIYLTLIARGVSTDFSPWWAQIFGMVCLIPTANVIRNLLQGWLKFLGVSEESWAGAATLGLVGFAGLANIGKTVLNAKVPRTGEVVPPIGSSSGGSSGGKGGGTGSFGGSSAGKAISSGMKVGSVLGTAGALVGRAVGTAMSLPLASTGVKLGNAGEALGGFVGTAIGRQLGTGSSIIKNSMSGYIGDPDRMYVDKKGRGLIKAVVDEEGRKQYFIPGQKGYENIKKPVETFKSEREAYKAGYRGSNDSFVKRLGNIVGKDDIHSPTDYVEIAGRVVGATFGATFGEKGVKVGMEAGGAAGRYGVNIAGMMLPLMTGNLDQFRWR